MPTTDDTFYIDHTLYSGSPADLSNRLPKEIRTYNLLDSLDIEYRRLDHDPVATIEACHDIDKILDVEICKNLFLRNAQKTSFYLLLIPGHKKFRTAILSKQIGSSRLSFGESEFMEELMDITPGSVSVLGLMNDKEHKIKLLIDQNVITQPYFGCHPCINTSSLKFKTSDLVYKILPAMDVEYTLVQL